MPEEAQGSIGSLFGGSVDIYRLGRFALSGKLTFVTGLWNGFVATAIGQPDSPIFKDRSTATARA